MKKLILIGCCNAKLDGMHPAEQLYTSQLFKKARTYAIQQYADWGILSAEHGYLRPKMMIKNYDTRLDSFSPTMHRAWAQNVEQQLSPYQDYTIIVLAGAAYGATWSKNFNVEFPMEGLGIGQRLKWLNDNSQKWDSKDTLNPRKKPTTVK